MDNTRIPKKVRNGKYSWEKTVEGPRLRWEDMVKYIKFRRLKWAAHTVQILEYRKKYGMENIHGRRPVERPRLRWEDNIRRDGLL